MLIRDSGCSRIRCPDSVNEWLRNFNMSEFIGARLARYKRMAEKGNIVQYRERLDNTLASPDLTNDQILKTLVKSQLQCSSKVETQGTGYEEKVIETKTAELCNFLDMLRSASVVNSGGSSTPHTDWKLKQDNEEFRVMYRKGPEGTPFHTLLVEGYVDGPLDLCLCLSWETPLYKKWWPQFTIPSFKVIEADRLQKVQIGEQISLVRMKLPWPLSTREAIVHYYLFEYFQDDLVVVLLKTVPESKSIDGFNNEAIPEAKDVVRIDLVGGYVMQKVSSERSYFRIIANLDVKLDLVPPVLINFISRQLIGSAFRLYQKAVASMMGHDKDKEFSKALGDSLYVRIREVLFSISESNSINEEELKQDETVTTTEAIQIEQDEAKDESDSSNQCANISNGEILDAGSEGIVEADCEEIVQIDEDVNKLLDVPIEEGDSWRKVKGKRNGEIVDADDVEVVQIEKNVNKVHDIQIKEDDSRSVMNSKMNVYIRPEVKKALETLDRVIPMVQEYGFRSLRSTSNLANEESHCTEKGGTIDSNSAKLDPVCLKNEVNARVSSIDTVEETSQEPGTIQNFRHTGTNPNLKEANYNKVVPASPEQNLSKSIEAGDSYSLKNGTTLDHTICDNKHLNSDVVQDISSDDLKKSSREIKYRYCCFLNQDSDDHDDYGGGCNGDNVEVMNDDSCDDTVVPQRLTTLYDSSHFYALATLASIPSSKSVSHQIKVSLFPRDTEMAKKGNIMLYRERLDKTIASPDLTNALILKTLVKSQFQRSSKLQTQGIAYKEKVVETNTVELCNFLDTLRSASVDNPGVSSTSHADWKLKQDNEEFRVMYCEGSEGTPFHTFLVEGYVDGPLDLCLCLSWETPLYKKWWPQFTIPSFKVIEADRLQKVQIGEQISLVRMKLPWPLSTREAIVHYYLFEYFQDDLVVVPESKSIDGFNNEAIPEAKDVVRIDLVGGYVMQKVSSKRSYFRLIANLDIKLDLVPPPLINFISRQIFGSAFRLYQKAVASMMGHDKDKELSKTLGDSLYVKIREVLFSISESNSINEEELKQDKTVTTTEAIQIEQEEPKDESCEDSSNQCANNSNGEILDAGSEEIVEADSEEIVQIDEDVNKVLDVPIEEGDSWSEVKGKWNAEIADADDKEIVQIEKNVNKVHGIPIKEDDSRSVMNNKMNVYIRPDVKKAVETIERVISMVQEYGFHSLWPTSNYANEESHCMEKGGTFDSNSAKFVAGCLKNEDNARVSSINLVEETSQESGRIQNFRHTGRNPNLKEVNYNKVVPASSEHNLSKPIEAADSYSLKHGTTSVHTICDNKNLNSDIAHDVSTDDLKKSSREIKYRNCCFSVLDKKRKV
ncbi:hypothetical protein VNO77_17905 [Canavalia gladiata]|uniref:START domain-containing protein n=1 Tax=Canavalia gladiata TaxID=3824 RepID=A0AAN9QN51_CANGL